MKNFRTLLVMCFLAMTTVVTAQVAEKWQGFRFSYNNYTADSKGDDYAALYAYELGYVKSFLISQESPLFFETGASVLFTNGDLVVTDGYYEVDATLKMYSLVVPFNMGCKIALSDKLSFYPYAGISLKAHLSGEIEYESGNSYDEFESIDVFDKEDMGARVFNRLQLGWQIGATLNFDKFNFGFSFGTDFMELTKNVDTKTVKASIGFNF